MKKTNKKVFIIIIVIAVIFVIGGVAFTFLGKQNNKEEFIKYAQQIFSSENGFIDSRLKLLSDKKKATQYENIGKISFNVDNDNINSNVSEEINNNFNISYAGNVDASNEMAEYLIKLNYSKNSNFPIFYKKVGKIQGIKSEKIYKNYFVTEKSNISSLLSNEAIEYDEIDDDNTSTSSNFENEFINALKENFEEKSFSKVSTQQEEGFVLDIEGEKFIEIFDELLDSIKNDEKILDSLNIQSNYIDFIKNSIKNSNLLGDKASITLYQKDGKLGRIILEINGVLKLDVKKALNGEILNYDISLTLNQNNDIIALNLSRKLDGLSDLETIEESYKIDFAYNDYNYSFNIENKINFTEVEIEKFAEGEYINIDKLTSEKKQQVFQLIGTKFIQGNLELMKQFGINNQNVLLSVLPNSESANYEENTETEENEEKQQENQTNTTNTTTGNSVGNTTGNSTSNTTSNTIGNNTTNTTTGNTTSSDLATSFSETEKKVFNANYEKYVGSEIDGNKLKSAIMEVIANNMSDEERQIKVTGVVTLTGNEVPDGIDLQKKYDIKLKYSSEGFVNEMAVSEKE